MDKLRLWLLLVIEQSDFLTIDFGGLMDQVKIHKVVSEDGIEIGAKVIGEGHPLVLLPPGPAESEQGWQHLLPFLKNRFACYLMNTRGRGLSADYPDHSPVKLVGDVISFAESIDRPVTLVEAGSGLWAYTAANNHPAIGAVAVYEPGVDEVMPDTIAGRLGEVFERLAEIAADGRLIEAAEFFIEQSHIIYSDEELATGVPRDFWRAAAVNIPIFLADEAAKAMPGVPSPTAPSALSKIKVPVLIMRGSQTTPWFIDSANYVAEHIKNSNIQVIDHAAHFGICTHPEDFADALTAFLTSR
jgi:pimeloyl-ACP methyl ester carboxylesterase